MTEELLTRKQFADRAGCSVKTITRAIKRGELPTVFTGKRLRIPASALEPKP